MGYSPVGSRPASGQILRTESLLLLLVYNWNLFRDSPLPLRSLHLFHVKPTLCDSMYVIIFKLILLNAVLQPTSTPNGHKKGEVNICGKTSSAHDQRNCTQTIPSQCYSSFIYQIKINSNHDREGCQSFFSHVPLYLEEAFLPTRVNFHHLEDSHL